MLGLLAGVLNGAAFGREVVDFNADDESECNTGHFIIALDVSRFLPIAAFKAQIDRQLRDCVVTGSAGSRLPFVCPVAAAVASGRPPVERCAGVSRGRGAARQARGGAFDQAAARASLERWKPRAP